MRSERIGLEMVMVLKGKRQARGGGMRALALMVVVGCGATVSSGASIVNFIPTPASPGIPELVFVGDGTPALNESAGSLGNGDGAQPPAFQTPGGLNISTLFTINGVPGSAINTATGATTFYDVSMNLTGFDANQPATVVAGTINQQLSDGTFALTATDGTLLLSGTAQLSVINGLSGGDSGGVLSATVTYTDGLIYDSLIGAGGQAGGSLSWSLLNVFPALGIGTNGYATPFMADATGLFSATVVPEPSVLSLLGLGSVALLRRRRLARS